MFLQQLANGLVLGSIYALIALGYTLVYGILLMINFAHSEIFMIGAFFALGAYTVITPLSTSPMLITLGVVGAGVVGAGMLGVITERFAYRPLRHASRLSPLISAIGVSILFQNILFLGVTNQTVSFPQFISVTSLSFFGMTLNSLQIVILVTALILMVALHLFIQKATLGKAMRACANDLETAGLMGIDANRIIALTFFIGGMLGGAAGVLNGLYYGSIKYNMGFMPGIKAFTAAVLGGIGNIAGAVLGGITLGILEVMATGYLPGGAEWKDVIAFMVLIAVLLIRPSGILGEKISEKI